MFLPSLPGAGLFSTINLERVAKMTNCRNKRRLAVFLIFTALAPFVLSAETAVDIAESLGLHSFQRGVEAPDFDLDYLDGERRALSSFRGQVVFLNFWATWCPPCREEMPSMQTLHERFSDLGLTMLAVDIRESKLAVQKFIDEFELTFAIPLDTDGRVSTMYGVRGIPTTYIIDRDGMLLAAVVGGRDWASDDANRYFEKVLGE